jgi:AI-2 transport protein TqsA
MDQQSNQSALTRYVNQTPSVRFVILAAGTIIILAAIYAAASFLVPILLSVLFAVVFWPPLVWLQKRGLSSGLALGLVLLGVVVIILILLGFLWITIGSFGESLPEYRAGLATQLDVLREMLRGIGIQPGQSQQDGESAVDPGQILTFVIGALGQLFSSGFIILFYVIFMLVEGTSFQHKLQAAFKDNAYAYDYFSRVTDSLQYYLVIKTRINLVTGAFITVALWLVGLDFALLWGFVAFLLNYVPNFGSIIAAIPAVILAFIQFGPGIELLLVIVVYLAVNILVGYWLEPKMMGQGLGLSALVVLIAVIFWGWILGPVGLILSVPITVTLKIFLESYEGSRWLATLLGSEEEAA